MIDSESERRGYELSKSREYINLNKSFDDLKKENDLLKNIIKAQAKMIIAYRLGKTQIPEWVIGTLQNANSVYGDLSEIK